MRPQQITALLTFGAAVFMALVAGISIATESYALLIFASTLIVIGTLVVMPGYVPLFVIGLLMPFSVPIPFIWNFPFLLIALGICGVKFWIQRGLRGKKDGMNFTAMTVPISLFMIWVLIRYCLRPAFPNVLGWGTNVTGFRAWLSYALCFGVVFYTGRLIANREGLHNLMQWLAYGSIFFILIFVPMTLSHSQAAARFFFQLGMFVSTFDNNMLRFVALPEFGLMLMSLLFMPNLLKLGRAARIVVFALGVSAVVLGGNRIGLGMAIIIVTVMPLLRRKWLQSAITIGSLVTVSATIYFAGPTLSQLPHTGFLRSLGLFSRDLSEVTGGNADLEWREVRWQRGLEEIRKHPFVGVGYGGLENALTSDFQSEEENQDMTLATGGVHNGYIAGALALGIPAACICVFILISQIFMNGRRALSLSELDPVLSEVHAFVCANLLADAASFFVGSDMNEPTLWFFLSLGIFASQLRRLEARKPAAAPVFVRPVLAPQFAR
jgi:O-antigen ligase